MLSVRHITPLTYQGAIDLPMIAPGWPNQQYYNPHCLWANDLRPGFMVDNQPSKYDFRVHLGTRSITVDTGFLTDDLATTQLDGFGPRGASYSRIVDGGRHGNLISGLSRLSRDGVGPAQDPSHSFYSENEVVHPSARGRVALGKAPALYNQNDQHFYYEYPNPQGPQMPVWSQKGVFQSSRQYFVFSSPMGAVDPADIFLSSGFHRDLEASGALVDTTAFGPSEDSYWSDTKMWAGEKIWFISYSDNRIYNWNFQIMYHHMSDSLFDVEITYNFMNIAKMTNRQICPKAWPYLRHDYDVSHRYTGEITGNPRDYSYGANYLPITSTANLHYIRTYTQTVDYDDYGIDAAYFYDRTSNVYETDMVIPLSAHSDPSDTPIFMSRISFYKDGFPIHGKITEETALVNDFDHFIDAIHPEVRPAAFISTGDCINQYASGSNFIESFGEIGESFAALGLAHRLIKLVWKAKSGNPAIVGETIDLIADTYLTYKYGYAPLPGDIKEAYRIATAAYTDMESLVAQMDRILYGQFTFDIPTPYKGMDGLTVDVRTKMVLNREISTVISQLLTVDGVGLLPELSRVWDLIPFSFIVDWFFNFGDRFRDVSDNAIALAIAPEYYVHSFTYKLPLTSDFIHPFLVDSVEPHLRVFRREVSRLHPLPKGSVYDFRAASSLDTDNFLVAGALLLGLRS